MSVILATWEAEIGKIMVQGQPERIVCEVNSRIREQNQWLPGVGVDYKEELSRVLDLLCIFTMVVNILLCICKTYRIHTGGALMYLTCISLKKKKLWLNIKSSTEFLGSQ
jgi:hypothetical protein